MLVTQELKDEQSRNVSDSLVVRSPRFSNLAATVAAEVVAVVGETPAEEMAAVEAVEVEARQVVGMVVAAVTASETFRVRDLILVAESSAHADEPQQPYGN